MRVAVTATATLIAALFVAPSTASAAGGVTCDGHRATIVGTNGNDVINGTSGNDVINGLGGRDVIHGGGGDDFICGGPGGDRLYGGAGNDQLFGQLDEVVLRNGKSSYQNGDVLDGGPGSDRLVGGADSRFPAGCGYCKRDVITWHSSPRGVLIHIGAGTADGDGHDRFGGRGVEVDGSTFGDTVYGSAGADVIATGPGSDWVDAGGGSDTVDPDFVTAGFGDAPSGSAHYVDRVFGGPGNDTISTHAGADIAHGGPGNDFIGSSSAPGAAYQFYGNSGNDEIDVRPLGATATPRLFGGTGVDSLDIDESGIEAPPIPPGEGNDSGSWNMLTGAMTLNTSTGPISIAAHQFENAYFGGFAWTVHGTEGPNDIQMQDTRGPNVFLGLAGDDTFEGSEGDDTFNGGPGTDHAVAMGGGTDTCISVEILDRSDCEHVTP